MKRKIESLTLTVAIAEAMLDAKEAAEAKEE